jgi:hypothetical protein
LNKNTFDKLTKKEQLNSTLDGVVYWAHVAKPKVSEKYKTTKFTLNLMLDADNQKKAIALGLKIKPADKSVPGPYVEITRKVKDGVDASTIKPEIVDKAQQPLKAGTLIGNGSTCRVKFGRYWYETGAGGVGTVLFKVQVVNLIAFDGSKDRDLIMDTSEAANTSEAGFNIDEFLAEDSSAA